MKSTLALCLILPATLGVVLTGTATAQPAATAENAANDSMPSGEEVMAICLKALGGEEKIGKVSTVTMKGTAEIPEFGIQGVATIHYRKGDVKATVTINGADTLQGVNDGIGWELSPTTGAKKMSKAETQQLVGSLSMNQFLNPKKFFKSIENVGKETIDDEECYHLKLTRKIDDGSEEMYLSVKSGLPMRAITSKETEFGQVGVVSNMSNYRKIDQIQTPMEIFSSLKELNMSYNVTFDSVKYNAPIDDAVFALPPQIKTLLGK